MRDLADIQLLRRYSKEQDEVSFAELVRRHVRVVYGVAWRCTRDAVLAEDVTQTTFMLLVQKASSLPEPNRGSPTRPDNLAV